MRCILINTSERLVRIPTEYNPPDILRQGTLGIHPTTTLRKELFCFGIAPPGESVPFAPAIPRVTTTRS